MSPEHLKDLSLPLVKYKITVSGYFIGDVFALRAHGEEDLEENWNPLEHDDLCSVDHVPSGYLVGRFEIGKAALLFALTALEWVQSDAARATIPEDVVKGFPDCLIGYRRYLLGKGRFDPIQSFSDWCKAESVIPFFAR